MPKSKEVTREDVVAAILNTYAGNNGALSNQDLYAKTAEHLGVSATQALERSPIGASGELHSLFARKIRWYQQTLKEAGILERVGRGVWALTKDAGNELSAIKPDVSVVGFSTDLGVAILGTCDHVFSRIDSPITLCLTSPPYPLAQSRRYGNVSESEYVDWICRQLEPIVRNLVPGGSICLNVSNDVFLPGSPARSLYCERLILALHDRLGLQKMDTFIWENRSKPPGPIQWASKKRVQLNVGWEPIYWLTNDPGKVKSDNRRVLREHTERHLKLINQGGETRNAVYSDGAYRVLPGSYGNVTEGSIPKNVLSFGHACGDQRAYKKLAASRGLPVHGAPMPLRLAKFLVEFLSIPGDLVVDPFGGSFTTAKAAETLGRRWISTERILEYVFGGSLRFTDCSGYVDHLRAA